jgi:hypothetical protein
MKGILMNRPELAYKKLRLTRSELAHKMLHYEEVKRKCDELEREIKDAVMWLEESVEVGNVRATLRGGRKTYDYQAAADGNPLVAAETVSRNSELKVDWKAVCEEANIKDIPFELSNPTVSIKLLEDR